MYWIQNQLSLEDLWQKSFAKTIPFIESWWLSWQSLAKTWSGEKPRDFTNYANNFTFSDSFYCLEGQTQGKKWHAWRTMGFRLIRNPNWEHLPFVYHCAYWIGKTVRNRFIWVGWSPPEKSSSKHTIVQDCRARLQFPFPKIVAFNLYYFLRWLLLI